jgi:hypothetical protein
MIERTDELIERVTKLFRQEWGSEFDESDTVRIADYCRDEIEVENIPYPFGETDIYVIAMKFEMRWVNDMQRST